MTSKTKPEDVESGRRPPHLPDLGFHLVLPSGSRPDLKLPASRSQILQPAGTKALSGGMHLRRCKANN